MHDFDYKAPFLLDEAIKILSENNGSARALAGGTDLIDHVRSGRLTPEIVVDVKNVIELSLLDMSDKRFILGATVPCYQIYENGPIEKAYTALTDSCRIIGGIQIQTRASVGGNLCNSGPAADTIPSLIALSAVCTIAGPNGSREIPVEEFCTGPGQNVLETGELLVSLTFPPREANSGSHYRRFIPRNEMDIAVVGVGASVVLDDSGENFVSGRIGLGAVAPTPLFAREASDLLAGQPVNDETIGKVAKAAQSIATPIDDMRGTKEFRLHLVDVLTQRVLRVAVERARNSN